MAKPTVERVAERIISPRARPREVHAADVLARLPITQPCSHSLRDISGFLHHRTTRER